MPITSTSRWFLSGALLHLSAAGFFLALDTFSGALSTNWDVLLWVLLIGFVGCTTFGFSYHLYPTVARRLLPKGNVDRLAFVACEASVILGAIALSGSAFGSCSGPVFSLSACLLVVSVALTISLFARALALTRLDTYRPEVRPGDAVTVPLFLSAWVSALVSGGLFTLSGIWEGPSYGFWIAAVHLFVLGHATLLIAAMSLRFVPRSLAADPPRPVVFALGGLGTVGAALVPIGMLTLPLSSSATLTLFAAPEAAFAVLFVAVLSLLGARARTPRPQLGLHLTAVLLFLTGGSLGLYMVSRGDYDPVVSHAIVNVLGFLGLTILFMWFGMIAPFQRISHAWTRRMLWGLSGGWLAAVLLLAMGGEAAWTIPEWVADVGGSILFGVSAAWTVGTIPVLFPKLNPLPGLSTDEVRTLRERWGKR